MTRSLYELAQAALNDIEAMANAALPGPWVVDGFTVYGGDELEMQVAVSSEARYIMHVASPEIVLRGVAEDRRTLERHSQKMYQEWLRDEPTPGGICKWCQRWWPCADVISVATRNGVFDVPDQTDDPHDLQDLG